MITLFFSMFLKNFKVISLKEKKKRRELILITDIIDKNVGKKLLLQNILINKYNKSRFFLFIYFLISNFYNQIQIKKIYDIPFYFQTTKFFVFYLCFHFHMKPNFQKEKLLSFYIFRKSIYINKVCTCVLCI